MKWRRVLRALATLGLLGALAWFALPFAVPLPVKLLKTAEASPVLLDRHGGPILHLTLPDSTRSSPLEADEIPADLVACTLAAEDKRFHTHGGIDPLATLRAGRDFLAKRRVVSGASTITQQLIKITSPPAARNPATKLREALAARRLEMTWSKRQILTAYLNHLDYGNLRIGATEAARFYFQKPLADLSLGECALLAGLPQSPSRLNPIRHPQRAIVRRHTVLERLAATGEYDAARIAAARAEPLSLRPLVEMKNAPWLSQISNPKSQIQTTLDLPLQRDFEMIVREETARLKDANLRHAAIVAIHNPT
ncbi:MAG: transglycosylase domain-containing protein, partial [Luteolibacter sp.]